MTRTRAVLAIACAITVLLLLPVAKRAARRAAPRAAPAGPADAEPVSDDTGRGAASASQPTAPLPNPALDAILDLLAADGTTEAHSERAGRKIERLLGERPERIEDCRRRLRATNDPRVMHALAVALTSWIVDPEEVKALVPDLLDAFDRTDDTPVHLAVLRGLVRVDEVDGAMKRVGSLLLRGTSPDIPWTVAACLAMMVHDHPERAPEATRIWVQYLESDDIHVARFCWGVGMLAEFDPAAVRALRPARRIADHPLAKECWDDAIRAADEGR
jgi:hypothetical protein